MIELGLHVPDSIYIESTPPSPVRIIIIIITKYIEWFARKWGTRAKERKFFHIIFNFHVACILFRFRSDVRRRILCSECTNASTTFLRRRTRSNVMPFTFCQCARLWWKRWGGGEGRGERRGVGRARLYVFPFNRLSLNRMYTFNYFSPHTQHKPMYLYLRDVLMRSSASRIGRGDDRIENVPTNRGIFFFLLTNHPHFQRFRLMAGATTLPSNRRHSGISRKKKVESVVDGIRDEKRRLDNNKYWIRKKNHRKRKSGFVRFSFPVEFLRPHFDWRCQCINDVAAAGATLRMENIRRWSTSGEVNMEIYNSNYYLNLIWIAVHVCHHQYATDIDVIFSGPWKRKKMFSWFFGSWFCSSFLALYFFF